MNCLNPNIFSQSSEKKSTRDGFGDALVELGELNKDVVVLAADIKESARCHIFANKFPDRFIEVGVAEQNMAGIATGLALSGKIPFMVSYAAFSPGRNWDQIRVSICYSQANVKIAGSHAGISVGPDGATHQALEDIALTRVLPNMTVISPADYIEAKKATIAAANIKGPVYLRFFREPTPIITTEEAPFEIGKAQVLVEGKDITIIASGPILYEVLKAADELKKENNLECEIINCATIKPPDENTILESAKKTKRVLTVEEHQISCGLGSAVCELLSEKFPVPVKRIGMNDKFGESGTYEELKQKFGFNTNNIKAEVNK